MKIVGSQIQQAVNAYQKQTKKVESGASFSLPEDQIELSSDAAGLLQAREAYNQLPDVREQKIADIKARIQNGTYKLTDSQIADAILGGSDQP